MEWPGWSSEVSDPGNQPLSSARGAVADNLGATVYARSARGGTRSAAARAGRRPGWTTASVSLTQGVHQLSNLRNAHSHECHLPTSLTHGAGLVEIEGVALKA